MSLSTTCRSANQDDAQNKRQVLPFSTKTFQSLLALEGFVSSVEPASAIVGRRDPSEIRHPRHSLSGIHLPSRIVILIHSTSLRTRVGEASVPSRKRESTRDAPSVIPACWSLPLQVVGQGAGIHLYAQVIPLTYRSVN